jgi:hypothetical protein
MKYLPHIIIGLVIIIAVYFGFFSGAKEQTVANEPADAPQAQWETKTDDQPPVTIKVTPVELGQNAEIWKFTLVLDTHSGSLDQDPIQIAVLTDDKGNTYRPSAWEGPGPGGHHREGILVFNPIDPSPEYVELKIKNIDGVSERVFKWSLE